MTAKYVCDKGHTFIHPAKQTKSNIELSFTFANNDDNAKMQTQNLASIETQVCPECQSIHFTEVPDDKQSLKDVTAMIDVEPNAVNAKLAEGYTILESWQKNVRLVKYKTEAQPCNL